jgi:O-antigen ligase
MAGVYSNSPLAPTPFDRVAMLDKAITIGLIIAVIFTGLAYGATEPWSVAIFEVIVTVLIMLWAVKVVRDKRLKIIVPMAALPIVGLIVIGVVQSVAIISSEGRARALSMDVEATRTAVIVLFFLLVSFVMAANFFAGRERLTLLANVLVIYGLGLSIFALVQHFGWDGRIYWLRPTEWATVFGPFANRNHYAGYMEMLVPLPIALIISRGVRRETWLFYGFAATVMGVTIIVSLSRGGMVGLIAGMIFLTLVGARVTRGRLADHDRAQGATSFWKRAGAIAAIAIAITAGVVWIGAEGIIKRAGDTFSQQINSKPEDNHFSREAIWHDTFAMIRANPVLGVGLGAYETVYPIYGRSDGFYVINYAHNDYLQVVADAGIAGGLLALIFVVMILRALKRATRSSDPVIAGFALASGASVFSLLVHSLFDFNLQIPSNALLFLIHAAVLSSIAASVPEGRSAVVASRAKAGDFATGV